VTRQPGGQETVTAVRARAGDCRESPRRVRALRLGYARSMSEVASRELRNDTAGVLRRVREGEDVTITVNGRPVAVLTAVRPRRRRWLSKTEFLSRLRRAQADPGLRKDLAVLGGDTTEDLGPIR
jgi:prevent-host-death family protein